jgi:hypothetical protein
VSFPARGGARCRRYGRGRHPRRRWAGGPDAARGQGGAAARSLGAVPAAALAALAALATGAYKAVVLSRALGLLPGCVQARPPGLHQPKVGGLMRSVGRWRHTVEVIVRILGGKFGGNTKAKMMGLVEGSARKLLALAPTMRVEAWPGARDAA